MRRPQMETGHMASRILTVLAAGLILAGAAGCSSRAKSSEVTVDEQAGIGVNAFLWRASLDTLSFMPLASEDPWGGVIITDWYANPQAPDERFKVTIYILDKRLRADGVKVSVFRQVKNTAGQWEDATADPALPANLENAILSRARQLRINANADS